MRTHQRYGIVASQFNQEITQRLLEGALSAFKAHKIPASQVDVMWVPGAFELSVGARKMAESKKYQAVVALGCILEGETKSYQYLSQATMTGLNLAGVLTGVPVTSGVITAQDRRKALARSRGTDLHRGKEAAEAAWSMVHAG